MRKYTEKKAKRRPFRQEEKSPLNIPASFVRGWTYYLRYMSAFENLERFCFFLGYPRSGHTLLGSLLNAHPEMLIAHEVNILRYVRHGFPRQPLLGLLLRRDQQFGAEGREWSGYDYNVPGQYQGKTTRLRVIGDKRGRGSTKQLSINPSLLVELRSRMQLPLAVIHHVRNPFDNIATMARRGNDSLETAAGRYFRFASIIREALISSGEERLSTHHDDLITDPKAELHRVIRFLGLSQPSEDYLEACRSIVFSTPSRSRERVAWPRELITSIEERIQQFPDLQRYRFAD